MHSKTVRTIDSLKSFLIANIQYNFLIKLEGMLLQDIVYWKIKRFLAVLASDTDIFVIIFDYVWI